MQAMTIKKSAMGLLIVIFLFLAAPSYAADADSLFSLEVDPATFFLKGYSLHFRFTPSNSAAAHWVFGLGIYALEFPDPLRDLVVNNSDDNLDLKLTHGYGLFSEYYLRPDRRGWFLGGQLALTQYDLHNPSKGSDAHYTTLLIMPRAGYRWFPFQNGFYLLPWIGVGYNPKVSGGTTVGDKTYHLSPILPFATLHLGYQF